MRLTAKMRWLSGVLILTVVLAGCRARKLPVPADIETMQTIVQDTAVTQATATPTESIEMTVPATVPTETTGMTEPRTESVETQPLATVPAETVPPATEPPTTAPPVTEPLATEPTAPPAAETIPTTPVPTEPEETVPSKTESIETTEPPKTEPPKETKPTAPTEEFKKEVAYYAAYYINQYRTASSTLTCTILPGMTQVAEYRADQLTFNYSHDSDDKRGALAYYEYGKWVDATIVGLDPSQSYYEADTTEAICAGFEGKTAEEMGKYIADLCRNSSSHWSYLGSSKNLYIGIGVEYRAGSTYGWYGCIMVGRTNYG